MISLSILCANHLINTKNWWNNIYPEKNRVCFVCFWRKNSQLTRTSSFTRFLDHTQRHTTVGRTPPKELSAPRIDLYFTTHNIHNKHPFEPAISADELPQTHAIDRVAIRTGENKSTPKINAVLMSLVPSPVPLGQRWKWTRKAVFGGGHV
jgi:hypothetical protein